MRNLYRSSLVLLAFVFALAGLAFADNLDVNISGASCLYGTICGLNAYTNGPGTPAQGSAIFPLISLAAGPWQFSFTTGDPTWWHKQSQVYDATFGVGGMFQMMAPDGLTFTGEITGGSVHSDPDAPILSGYFTFDGQWANSEYASGNLGFIFQEPFDSYASLMVSTEVPEPTSLAFSAPELPECWQRIAASGSKRQSSKPATLSDRGPHFPSFGKCRSWD